MDVVGRATDHHCDGAIRAGRADGIHRVSDGDCASKRGRSSRTINRNPIIASDRQFEIAEVPLPSKFIGKTIMETNLRKTYSLNVVTILREDEITIPGGKKSIANCVVGVVTPETEFKQKDVLVLFGKSKDIEAFVEKYAE